MAATYDLVPDAIDSNPGGWSGAATDVDDPWATPDDASTQISVSGVNASSKGIVFTLANMASAVLINSVTFRYRIRGGNGTQEFLAGVVIGGTSYLDSTRIPGTGWVTYEKVYATNPSTGQAWTKADLDAAKVTLNVEDPALGGASAFCTQLIFRVDYIPTPQQIEQSREIPSRRLRLYRRPTAMATIEGPLELLDVELGDVLWLSHPHAPAADGLGWGVKKWQRLPFLALARGPDPMRGRAVLEALDLTLYWTLFWDIAISKKSSSNLADGIARLGSGGTRTFSRASKAWVEDPGDGRLVELADNDEKNDVLGLLLEQASTNRIIQSTFAQGSGSTFTGWTNAGTGSNGSAINEETADIKADSAVSTRCVKFTAGTPIHASDLQITSTATASVAANTVGSAAVFRKDDDASEPTYVAIQRGVDSRWWRASDRTWQVAKTWNALAGTTSWARAILSRIDVGASGTTITIVVGIPTTAAAGQINRVQHVQWEDLPHPTSMIHTTTVAVTRALDSLVQSNNSGARCWSGVRGSFTVQAIPNWDAADVATVNKTVLWIDHDASNWVWLYFDGPNARWVFEVRAAGSTYRAVKTASPTRGTTYKIQARWTSSETELDLAAYTLSVFVDDVKGTDVTAAAMTEDATANMERGSKASAEYFDGHLHHWDVSQRVLTDAELAQRP